MFTKGALYALKEGMKSEGWGGRKEVLGEKELFELLGLEGRGCERGGCEREEDVSGEDVSGKDVSGEDMGGKDMSGEDVGMDETVVDWGRNKHIALEPGLNVA